MVLKFKRHRQVGTGQRLQPTNLSQYTATNPLPAARHGNNGHGGAAEPADRIQRSLCIGYFCIVTQICGVATRPQAEKLAAALA